MHLIRVVNNLAHRDNRAIHSHCHNTSSEVCPSPNLLLALFEVPIISLALLLLCYPMQDSSHPCNNLITCPIAEIVYKKHSFISPTCQILRWLTVSLTRLDPWRRMTEFRSATVLLSLGMGTHMFCVRWSSEKLCSCWCLMFIWVAGLRCLALGHRVII